MKNNSYNNFFSNFSNTTRLRIIMALREGPLSVNNISERLKEEQSKISHNLGILTGCHILDMKKKGKERIYSLNKDTVIPLLKIVEKHIKNNCPLNCCK